MMNELLRNELKFSSGCTEPSSIAYAVAFSKKYLEGIPERIDVSLSSNVLKNALCVGIPNTNCHGIELIILLGLISNCDEKLTLLKNVSSEDLIIAKNLYRNVQITIHMAEDVDPLYICAELWNKSCNVCTTIEGLHDKIKSCRVNGQEIIKNTTDISNNSTKFDFLYSEILDFIRNGKYDKELIRKVKSYNMHICEYGEQNQVGLNTGKVIKNSDIYNQGYGNIIAKTVSGIDARMSGISNKVVVNSGSGNQGITATVPVLEFAKMKNISEEKTNSAIVLSHLTSIYIRSKQGRLSSSCGIVCASTGVAAAITYLLGGTDEMICGAIKNNLCANFGMFCDGAKTTCAIKTASCISAAINSAYFAMNGVLINDNIGIISSDIDDTVSNLSIIEKKLTKEMDTVIMQQCIRNVQRDK